MFSERMVNLWSIIHLGHLYSLSPQYQLRACIESKDLEVELHKCRDKWRRYENMNHHMDLEQKGIILARYAVGIKRSKHPDIAKQAHLL